MKNNNLTLEDIQKIFNELNLGKQSDDILQKVLNSYPYMEMVHIDKTQNEIIKGIIKTDIINIFKDEKLIFLFLDDIRQPIEVYEYTKQEIFKQKWQILRNFNEFKDYIETNGLPYFISFDHDLSDIKEDSNYKEKTGYECALWLVDYCIDNNLKLPNYYCHSMNPVGKDNILGLLKSFENNQN